MTKNGTKERTPQQRWQHKVNNKLTVLTNHAELIVMNIERGNYDMCRDSAIKLRERLFELDEFLRTEGPEFIAGGVD